MTTLRQAITSRKEGLLAQIESAKQAMRDTIAPLQSALNVEEARLNQFAPYLDMALADIQTELAAGIARYAAEAGT